MTNLNRGSDKPKHWSRIHGGLFGIAFVAFGVNFVFSLKYLIQRKTNDDLLAAAAAELGVVFCTIALLSGPIWARYAWNTWWNWEPRLTSTLILWLMYIGYFILRSALAADKRNIYSAVLGTIAYLEVPIVYYSVNIWQGGMHPGTGTIRTRWSCSLVEWFESQLYHSTPQPADTGRRASIASCVVLSRRRETGSAVPHFS